MRFNPLSSLGRAFLPRAFRNPLTDLAYRCGSDKGLTTRGHGYTRVYHHFFGSIRPDVKSLLEIGLQRRPRQHGRATRSSDAPSLRMWRAYFPNASLVGFDIREFGELGLPDCTVLRGDQGSEADLARAAAAAPDGYDIIIDDGSHASAHQQLSFAVLFPHLKPGGYYVIEDLHWQPADEEEPGIEKTNAIFIRFAATGVLSGGYFADRGLADGIEKTWLFDSLDTTDPVYAANALLVVRKKK